MIGKDTLTIQDFNDLVSQTRMKETAIDAARRVLVDGKKPMDVADEMHISHQLVYRAVARLNPRRICPECGHAHRAKMAIAH